MIIELVQGDITKIQVDAIVNAANSALRGGGGVDGAIHAAGGSEILEECMQIRGGCPVGEARITTAGKLPAKKVIHTVGPQWGKEDKEEEKLANCYINSLELARKHGLNSIAFPNISTGIYHFPKQKAAEIAIKTVKKNIKPGQEVFFVCYDDENFAIYKQELQAHAAQDQ
ncbi:O-acetyl-ADP-ribose deacetylase [Flavimarina sp. Hel_I_48]|uniref:O-acetyl-ADP-ribose deacetylase n=1 Tax=Flavimarina sp. Hel_I_48 TaxID=1392488 RepID=UPI0004DF2B58|nr:O-acetyl-ADP-ribose deacetylase [Flavimarina sp. Hel_I_48]